MTKFRLADLVAPQSADEFLGTIYGRSWAHWKTDDGNRFSGLANWETVSTILGTQRFDSPRFRVIRQGTVIPVECFTEQFGRAEATPYRRIVFDPLMRELRNGATLSLDRIEQAHEPARVLAAQLESELKAPVFVNMFASLGSVPGLHVHWDEQDAFVLQIEGRKRWRIFEPTRPWPLYRDVTEVPKPDPQPVAEVDLVPGDVLYFPHGWWHSANAIDEPSLHLTLAVEPHSGIDFLFWLVDQARAQELFRRRLPRFDDAGGKDGYLSSFRSAWDELLGAESVLDQYFTYADGTSRSLPVFSLPEVFNTNTVLAQQDRLVVPVAPRATVNQNDDGFVLTALGRRWQFPATVKPLIDTLLGANDITVRQALAMSTTVDEQQSAEVIFMLLRAGVIALQ